MIKLILLLVAIWAAYSWWRSSNAARTPALPDAEARAVLGVGPQADADTIRAAHRRLLAGVHPDRGGSAELTRRVNAARDVLLRR